MLRPIVGCQLQALQALHASEIPCHKLQLMTAVKCFIRVD